MPGPRSGAGAIAGWVTIARRRPTAMRCAARSSHAFSASVKRPPSRSAFFDAATWARLRAVKAAYDPGDVLRGNHHIPSA